MLAFDYLNYSNLFNDISIKMNPRIIGSTPKTMELEDAWN
jgi:hypothetical protein